MTQEEKKKLLTKVLCEQLPHMVRAAIDFRSYIAWLPDDEDLAYPYRMNLNIVLGNKQKTIDDISKEPYIVCSYLCTERFSMLRGGLCYKNEDYGVPVEFIKPYLRPLSSMTEEAKGQTRDFWIDADTRIFATRLIDFYNKNHFDYRGLIPKGLAIAAVGENNPYKEKGGTK